MAGFLPGPLRLLMLPSKELGKQVLTGGDISNLDFLHRNQMLGKSWMFFVEKAGAVDHLMPGKF